MTNTRRDWMYTKARKVSLEADVLLFQRTLHTSDTSVTREEVRDAGTRLRDALAELDEVNDFLTIVEHQHEPIALLPQWIIIAGAIYLALMLAVVVYLGALAR